MDEIKIPTLDEVLAKVDAFLARHAMKESRLGRDSTGESSLITTMRDGRHPSLKTLIKLDEFMAAHDAAAAGEPGGSALRPFSSNCSGSVPPSPGQLLSSLADAARTVS